MRKALLRLLERPGFGKYVFGFGLTVILAVALLGFSAFFPQSAIEHHIINSGDIMNHDLMELQIADRSTASTMDAGTDMLILRTSIATSDRYLGSILTNPVYTYSDLEGDWLGNAESVLRIAYNIPHDGSWSYARYWLGFRVLVRLALVFFDYAQLKRYLAAVFFLLMAAAMSSVSKHADAKLGFLFAVSIILMRPHIIATSMQFTCCFLIAFLAMLLIPWLKRHSKCEALFFMEVGMITMYFDFYTVPLITLGFPLVYLYALKVLDGGRLGVRLALKDTVAWFGGWGFMWIAKLVLTSLLTSVNALESGIQSFLSRIGAVKDVELEKYYSLSAAFDGIREAVFSDTTGKVVYLVGAALVLALICLLFRRAAVTGGNLREHGMLLVIACVPLVWFVITKQPIAIHYFFQYRTIALTHWAVGAYVWCILQKPKGTLQITEK